MRKPSLPLRLACALLHEIASGQHDEAARFLSRREIMRQWEVSSPTASAALALLAKWQVLRARDRSGHRFTRDARRRALLRLHRTSLAPLAGRPAWTARARALSHGHAPLRHIAVVSLVPPPAPRSTRDDADHAPLAAVPIEPAVRLPARAIFAAARKAGVLVDFHLHDGSADAAREIARGLLRSGAQGLIILRRRFATPVAPLAAPLLAAGVPVVAAFDDSEGLGIPTVNFNNLALGHAAARRLIAAGHRRIVVALPRTEESPAYFRERLAGCRLAAREAKPHEVEIVPVTGDFPSPRASSRLLAALRADPLRRPPALFSTTAEILAAALPDLEAAGLRAPHDLSVIMCSGTPRPPGAARDFDFLRLDFAAVGRRAFAALHALHEGKFTAKIALIEATCRACGTVGGAG